uniref:Serine palmitoyltransferase small subunit B n=1 Tax=Eptatretus burgeri TaxID=7764 RepID=A0A8C4WTF3_EPTBU
MATFLRHALDKLCWLYYQYLLVTCCYVMEPWEQTLFNFIFISTIDMVFYTTYVFVSIHVYLATRFLLKLHFVDVIHIESRCSSCTS